MFDNNLQHNPPNRQIIKKQAKIRSEGQIRGLVYHNSPLALGLA